MAFKVTSLQLKVSILQCISSYLDILVQFFQYETVSLSCGDQTEDPQWTILRNTSKHKNQRNLNQNKSSWFFNGNIYYRDSGVYWCQSEEGECGAAVNITVTGGYVILESPVLPVTEGERVTLRCITNPNEPALEGTFDFFEDSLWIGNSSSGNLTLSNVSVLDSGLYMCRYAEQLSKCFVGKACDPLLELCLHEVFLCTRAAHS
uniref:Ig-like domain-containing protein n=1 Tax=Neogobius melanostomus TaxID=47308 RepID=A0A8C6TEF9_9GOBI